MPNEAPQPGAGPDPITIDFNLNSMIQRVDANVTQEVIVTTADKAKLCLLEALNRLEQRKAWIAPAGILATLVVVFPTTAFQDTLGLSKDFWRALVWFWAIATVVWLVACLSKFRTSLTVDQVVDRLRNSSLSPGRTVNAPLAANRDLLILDADYGSGEHRVDVAAVLNRSVADNQLRIYAGNQLAGDPCPGIAKELRVRYRYKGKEYTRAVGEGLDLKLP